MQLVRGGNLDHGKVGALVHPFDLGRGGMTVAEGHLDLGGAAHDVGIGQDVSLLVDHDARPFSLCKGASTAARDRGGDRDDAVLYLLVNGGE